jgi:hypothetical protein
MPPSASTGHGTAGRRARAGSRLVAERAALAVTAVILVGLVVLKALTRPAWRASARTRLGGCVPEQVGAHPPERLHLLGRLATCAGRVEPIRTDYLELSAGAVLLVLLVVELLWFLRERSSAGAGDVR